MKHSKFGQVVLSFLAVSGAAMAQNIPDAGALMRQTEQNIRQLQLQQAAQQRESLPPAAVLTDSIAVTVTRFKFHGNKLLTTEQLMAVAVPYTNRTLNQHDLQRLTDAVSDAYRKAGWQVQVYIPRQNFTGSELTVQVIEGATKAQ